MLKSDAEIKALKLLAKVYLQSLANTLDWEKTASDNIFTANVKERYVLSIGTDFKVYFLRLLDSDGASIVQFKSDGPNRFELLDIGKAGNKHLEEALKEIYEMARIKALKISEKIDDAFNLMDDVKIGPLPGMKKKDSE